MNKLEHHPIADIFPLMEGEEYEEFKASVAKAGVRVPVVLHEGKILDGRNRHRAGTETGHEVPTVEWDGNGSPVDFVYAMNADRRHLTPGQLGMVASKTKDYEAKEAKKRKVAAGKRHGRGQEKVVENLPPPIDVGKARDKAGARVKVSGKTVDHCDKVRKKGSPALVEAVATGKMAPSAASQLTGLPKARQTQIAKTTMVDKKKGREEAKKALGKSNGKATDNGAPWQKKTIAWSFFEKLESEVTALCRLAEKPDLEVSIVGVRESGRKIRALLQTLLPKGG